MGYDDDQRIYRTFEEFEREELRRTGLSASVDEMLGSLFAEELDLDASLVRRSAAADDDEE